MSLASMTPDQWQTTLLRSSDPRTLLLCSRQSGKSQTAAALAIKTAVLEAPALILILSPSLRQSGELYRAKLLPLLRGVLPVVEVVQETKLQLELSNGSRIVSLPENEIGIRGYSGVSLLIIDEAARVSDGLYLAVRPMLAVSRGRLIALSTPYGKRGWFYDEWISARPWQRIRITADECPRIPPEFLKEERETLGERYYRQEYECSFEETEDTVFSHDDIIAGAATYSDSIL